MLDLEYLAALRNYRMPKMLVLKHLPAVFVFVLILYVIAALMELFL